jgi:hypothetical protein
MAATAAVQPALVEVGDPFEGIPMVGVRGSRSLVGEVAVVQSDDLRLEYLPGK